MFFYEKKKVSFSKNNFEEKYEKEKDLFLKKEMGLKGFEKRRIFGKVLGVERKKILKTYFERKIKKKNGIKRKRKLKKL